MYQSKLIEIFSSLSQKEKNRLKKFVYSPYHNKHKKVQQLFDYLMTAESFRLPQAFQAIFPNQEYQPQKVRNTMTYLQRLIDKFLICETLEQDSDLYNASLLKIYRQRKLDKSFKSTWKKSTNLQLKNTQSIDYFYINYKLQEEHFIFYNDKNRLETKNMQEVLDSFDLFYVANKLKYSVAALTHQNIFSSHYSLHMIVPILDFIQKQNLLSQPAIAAYCYSYLALIDIQNTDSFFHLKNILLTQSQVLQPEELRQIYLLAINFCIKHLNMGNEDFVGEIYELYKAGLTKGIFIENGEMSRFTYKNIVAIGLKSGNYTWVSIFIEDYAHYLPPQHQESYVNYNQAKLYYSLKNYQKAMQIFIQLDHTDRIVIIDSKVTLLKIYYELREHDALDSLLESFNSYIRRNKELSPYLKTSYLNLIKYLQKVLHLNFYNQKAKQKLLLHIQEEKQLPERKWILSLLQ